MNASREEILSALDSEFDYQIKHWPDKEDPTRPNQLTIGEFLSLMDVYVRRAQDKWATGTKPEVQTLHVVRKIAAVAWQCMVQHGAPTREGAPPRCAQPVMDPKVRLQRQIAEACCTARKRVSQMSAKEKAELSARARELMNATEEPITLSTYVVNQATDPADKAKDAAQHMGKEERHTLLQAARKIGEYAQMGPTTRLVNMLREVQKEMNDLSHPEKEALAAEAKAIMRATGKMV